MGIKVYVVLCICKFGLYIVDIFSTKELAEKEASYWREKVEQSNYSYYVREFNVSSIEEEREILKQLS